MIRLCAFVLFCSFALSAAAQTSSLTLRIATFNTELSRKGPGLLLRDINRGKDPQIAEILRVLALADADILLLLGFDWDLEGRAITAFRDRLAQNVAPYPHIYAPMPNRGVPSGQDLDGDGTRHEARDAQGYGRFTGQGGMAVLSRFAIDDRTVRNVSDLLWRELPGARMPRQADERPFPSVDAQAIQRLSTTGHWVVPLTLSPDVTLSLMAFHATTPLFDGDEDRNGLRNADEIRFWQVLLDGELPPAPSAPWVIAGGANLDPQRGSGRREAIQRLLADPRLQDVVPADDRGDGTTVDWGNNRRMRVDYLLPSRDIIVVDSGVLWSSDLPNSDLQNSDRAATRHGLVWMDLQINQ
ncbi:endonuclease/exonuclease/phosphatase family protein [Phaeobacter sp.]|uniref:endonuclease/exonuclease/phosphatase family protein n=1 Tax=Phaeobacter sp. TaxID=1902409 RepID=UPI0025DB0302|nr:endonuclease/exonuclease/phosphatase family protein [Phaeobacter sp.]